MKKETTKQRIAAEAVRLFSRNGYEAVTVEQIAAAVGIKAPSLYKHYKSKKEIFESVLEQMNRMDYERAKAYEVPEGTVQEMAKKYAKTPLEKIRTYSLAQFLHWTEDDFSSSFRRMLTIEQFKNQRMAALFQNYLCSGPTEYMADLFAQITGDEENKMQLAIEFYSPMFMLYSMYDTAGDEAERKRITEMLDKHIDRFAKRLETEYEIRQGEE